MSVKIRMPGESALPLNPSFQSSPDKALHYISHHPLFAPLSSTTWHRLADLLELVRCGANETIFHFNDPGEEMYFLCEGSVRFITRDYTGHEVILEEIQQGDLFGEVALFTGGERAADAVVTSDAVLLRLRRSKQKAFLHCCPEIAEFFITRLATRLSSSNRLLRSANTGVEELVEAERSPFDRIVKKMVGIFGTFPSFLIHITIVVLWIVLKWVFHAPIMRFEDNELLILSILLNVEGFAVSMLILVNQARESKEEGLRDRTEFEATMHTDNAIRYMHQKMDALTAEVHRQAKAKPRVRSVQRVRPQYRARRILR